MKEGLAVSAGVGTSSSGNPATLSRVAEVIQTDHLDTGIDPELWARATADRPSWMSRRQHEALLRDAYQAEGSTEAALRRVVRDLEKLR